MITISHEDIMKLSITSDDCYAWVKEMIAHKENTILKPKISLKFNENGFYNTMPAILPDSNTVGVKVVSRYVDRNPALDSQILLYDLESGHLDALMDGNFITTMRTGAVAAYTIQLLAKKDFEVVGFIGLGNTARATLKVLMSIYPEKHFTIKVKQYKQQHNEFINLYQSQYPNVTFEVVQTDLELIESSDVVISSVTFTNDIFAPDESYKEGCLIVPIHTRGFQNCDLFFDKVFADDRGHVEGFQYFSKFKEFAELTDVVMNKNKGRENDQQRILAYNIGIAIHDMFFAKKIYQKMLQHKEDIGELNQLTDKFWVQ